MASNLDGFETRWFRNSSRRATGESKRQSVAGFARIQDVLNSGESSYGSFPPAACPRVSEVLRKSPKVLTSFAPGKNWVSLLKRNPWANGGNVPLAIPSWQTGTPKILSSCSHGAVATGYSTNTNILCSYQPFSQKAKEVLLWVTRSRFAPCFL